MKNNKMYLRLQFNNGNHQMIRVDDIKEFKEIIDSEQYSEFKKLLDLKIKSHIASGVKTKFVPEPFRVSVTNEMFESMSREINRKSGNWKKHQYEQFSLVLSSSTMPLIKINRIG